MSFIVFCKLKILYNPQRERKHCQIKTAVKVLISEALWRLIRSVKLRKIIANRILHILKRCYKTCQLIRDKSHHKSDFYTHRHQNLLYVLLKKLGTKSLGWEKPVDHVDNSEKKRAVFLGNEGNLLANFGDILEENCVPQKY